MQLENVHGVNVRMMFEDWFEREYSDVPKLFKDRTGFAFVLLDADRRIDAFQNWENSLKFAVLTCVAGPAEQSGWSHGTYRNVERKLRPVLRSWGQPSLKFERGRELAHLVRPGDFPWQGAGMYKMHIAGVSGLRKEDDWAVCKKCIDKLIQLMALVNNAANKRAGELSNDFSDSVPAKYLEKIDVSDLFPEYAAA